MDSTAQRCRSAPGLMIVGAALAIVIWYSSYTLDACDKLVVMGHSGAEAAPLFEVCQGGCPPEHWTRSLISLQMQELWYLLSRWLYCCCITQDLWSLLSVVQVLWTDSNAVWSLFHGWGHTIGRYAHVVSKATSEMPTQSLLHLFCP